MKRKLKTPVIKPVILTDICVILFIKTAQVLSWPDNWTATTKDGKRTAQFEHTLLITPEGVEALTGKIETSPLQFWEKESEVHKGFFLGTTPAARERASQLTATKI